jgi:hypothetical protein
MAIFAKCVFHTENVLGTVMKKSKSGAFQENEKRMPDRAAEGKRDFFGRL